MEERYRSLGPNAIGRAISGHKLDGEYTFVPVKPFPKFGPCVVSAITADAYGHDFGERARFVNQNTAQPIDGVL